MILEKDYKTFMLLTLVKRIRRTGDPEAVREVCRRELYVISRDLPPVSFIEFVAYLAGNAHKYPQFRLNDEGREYVCDKLIERFTHRPLDGEKCRHPHGADCRKLFGTLIEWVERWGKDHPEAGVLEIEEATARILQWLVMLNFFRLCREARRQFRSGRSRYRWTLPTGGLWVWMPKFLSGRNRGAWLTANIDDPDRTRPGERERVQAMIDDRLGKARCFSMGAMDHLPRSSYFRIIPNTPSLEETIGVRGLALILAEEKMRTIHHQRPTIQALGSDRLKELVLRICESLESGNYEERRLATVFGLSAATFTRFAGGRWHHKDAPGSKIVVPDLWKNLARLLATQAVLIEMAKQAGVWERVIEILRAGGPN